MTELEQQQKIERGREAERILNNPLIQAAFERLEHDIIEAWATIPIRDKEGAEELGRLVKTARKFRNLFKSYLDEGKYTAHQLAESEAEAERLMQRAGRYMRRVMP